MMNSLFKMLTRLWIAARLLALRIDADRHLYFGPCDGTHQLNWCALNPRLYVLRRLCLAVIREIFSWAFLLVTISDASIFRALD